MFVASATMDSSTVTFDNVFCKLRLPGKKETTGASKSKVSRVFLKILFLISI